jgi:hypothetical protein
MLTKDFTSWMEKYGILFKINEEDTLMLNKMYDWCLTNNLERTPTIIVNGKPFPYLYNALDFEFLMENIYDNTNEEFGSR